MERNEDESVVNWEVCHYQSEQLHELSLKYHGDKKYRDKANKDSGELLKSLGVALPEGIDARFVVNTDKTWYFVLPPRPGRKAHVHRRDAAAAAATGDLNLINAASLAATLASLRRREP